jgi:dUTPase
MGRQHIPWLHPCLHGQPEFYNQIVTEIEYVLVICSRLYLQHKHTVICSKLANHVWSSYRSSVKSIILLVSDSKSVVSVRDSKIVVLVD